MKSLIELTQNLFHYNASLLAQVEYSHSSQGEPPSPVSMIVGLLFAMLIIVAMCKVFIKVGHPGWASIIAIYNLYIWCMIDVSPCCRIMYIHILFVNFIVALILW